MSEEKMVNKIPEYITEMVKQYTELASEVEVKKKELRDLCYSELCSEELITEAVLRLIGIKPRVIYTFPADVLCDKEIMAEFFIVLIEDNNEVYVVFLEAFSSSIRGDPKFRDRYEHSLASLLAKEKVVVK